MIEITKENFSAEVERSELPVVIDLYADWCGPCKMLAPNIAALESELSGVKFCKINVDREPELAKAFRVTSIPMIAVVKDNVFVDFSVGYMDKEALSAFVEGCLV